MVECTGLENRQSRKVLVGSNPTASAISAAGVVLLAGALMTAGCTYFAEPPGETRVGRSQQRAITERIVELSKRARPDCRNHPVTDTEIVDLHPDGKVSLERWTVTRCGERARFAVTFPPTGRGTGFLVQPER